MHKATNKLGDRLVDIAEQTVVDAFETYDVDHNKDSIKGALKSVLNELLVFILDNSSQIRESFKGAVISVATAPKLLPIIASEVAKDSSAMTPIAWYAAKTVKQGAEKAVKGLVCNPLFPPP